MGRGVYFGKYILLPPPLPGGDISQCRLGEKHDKREEKKDEYVKKKKREKTNYEDKIEVNGKIMHKGQK
jgi:hypothetical protein